MFPTTTTLVTKAQVKEIAEKYGCQTSFDGDTRTMYIFGGNTDKAFEEAMNLEGDRHFMIRTKHVRASKH